MANPRKVAASVLVKIENDNAYSNITLASVFKETELSQEDKRLVSRLVYGVLDRKITLDYVLSKFMKTPIKKTAPFTLSVLRCALYQIMFMDKIPDSAAVNEAVKIIKKSKENRNSGFVNAVLRSILRSNIELPKGNSAKDLSVRYSCPLYITESFIKDYGTDTAIKLLEESLKTPPVVLRVNTVKTNKENLKEILIFEGLNTEDADTENALILEKGTDVSKSKAFKDGLYYVQDTASQKSVAVLSPNKNQRVLDVCSAPGGKSFLMAQFMENSGEIISCDLYSHKIELIKATAKRLGLDIIKPMVNDATVFNSELGLFDAVLCDVPCSGFGVLRRKPEIKYKEQDDFSELQKIQLQILETSVKYLKENGKILYSTCTLRKGENEDNIKQFLSEHKEFKLEYEHTFMPHIDNTDGFYCALLVKS